MKSKVALVRCPDYDPANLEVATAKAVDLIGGARAFAGSGSRVLLKPNVMMPKPLGSACNTHPEFVRAVIGIFRALGAAVTVGESSAGSQAGLTFTERALRESGVDEISRKAGADVVNFDRAAVENVASPNPLAPTIPLAKPVRSSDLVVSLPKLKTHAFATYLTGAVKNCYGMVPGQVKADFHRRAPRPEAFYSIVRDVFRAAAPRLAIMDAVTAMEGNGPSAGRERRLGFILASADSVALDAVASALIGIPPLKVLTTRLCHEAGLGQGDLDQIEVLGEDLERSVDRGFKKPAVGAPPAALYRVILDLAATRPVFDHAVCRKCGICADSCPMKAISEKSGKMDIDRNACIRCFCCAEVCPHHALSPKRKNFLGGIVAKALSSRW